MITINVQQLHDETEHFVRRAREEEVHVQADGAVVAVLTAPRVPAADFPAYWHQREAALANVRLNGDWNSTEAVSQDRERL